MAVERCGARAVSCARRPRGQHIEHRIDLHGIGIDDRRRRAARPAPAPARDLPLAVGPAIRIAFLMPPSAPDFSMPLVATLISHPAARRSRRRRSRLWPHRTVGASAISWLGRRRSPATSRCPTASTATRPRRMLGAALVGRADRHRRPRSPHVRRKKILIADMDSTMIDQECIDELADEVGLKDRVAAITARSMNGEIAFEPALRERVALLKGLDATVVDRHHRASASRWPPAAARWCATMRANGAWTALVSGGFTVFTVDDRRHARLRREPRQPPARSEDGTPDRRGRRADPRPRGQGRGAERHRRPALGLIADDAIAVGDGANDLDMIRLAGIGRRAARQAVGRRPGEDPHRPWRPDRAALPAGLSRGGVRGVTPIRTERLILRNWEERDRDLFHRINSDDRVMEFFPFRRDRATADAFMDGCVPTSPRTATAGPLPRSRRSGECIGFIGLHPVEIRRTAGRPIRRDRLAAGARILGQAAIATEGAAALLAFGFDHLRLREIISFAVAGNTRSTAVMERLGMTRDPVGRFRSSARSGSTPTSSGMCSIASAGKSG